MSTSSKLRALKTLARRRSNFNPSQARDETGRWAKTGSDAIAPATPKRKAKAKSQVEPTRAEMPTGEEFTKAKLSPLVVGAGGTKNAAFLYKTRIGGKSFFVKGVADPDKAQAEETASAIAQAIGSPDLVPPVVRFKRKMREYGEVDMIGMPLLEGGSLEAMGDVGVAERMGETDAMKHLLFDFTIGMSDRHPGNLFEDGQGRIRLIDHESAFVPYNTIDLDSSFYLKFDPDFSETGKPSPQGRRQQFSRQDVEQIVSKKEEILAIARKQGRPFIRQAAALQKRLEALERMAADGDFSLGHLLDVINYR